MHRTIPIILLAALALFGCEPPVPMNAEAANSYKICMEKGWIPTYFSNGMTTSLDCKPKRDPVPMNAETERVYQQCLAKDQSAVYDALTLSIFCVQKGADLTLNH